MSVSTVMAYQGRIWRVSILLMSAFLIAAAVVQGTVFLCVGADGHVGIKIGSILCGECCARSCSPEVCSQPHDASQFVMCGTAAGCIGCDNVPLVPGGSQCVPLSTKFPSLRCKAQGNRHSSDSVLGVPLYRRAPLPQSTQLQPRASILESLRTIVLTI